MWKDAEEYGRIRKDIRKNTEEYGRRKNTEEYRGRCERAARHGAHPPKLNGYGKLQLVIFLAITLTEPTTTGNKRVFLKVGLIIRMAPRINRNI